MGSLRLVQFCLDLIFGNLCVSMSLGALVVIVSDFCVTTDRGSSIELELSRDFVLLLAQVHPRQCNG